MNKRRTRIIVILTALIALLFIGRALFGSEKTNPVELESEQAVKGDIKAVITATGTIEPVRQVEVGTQVSGVVKKVYVDYNSRVKAGQLIAELDKTNLLASLTEAEASYKTALNEQQYLQKIFTRQKDLYANKLISEADYDEALYKLNAAKNSVVQRESDLNKARTNLRYAEIYSPIDGVVLSRDVDEGQTVAASFSTPTLFTIARDLKEMQVEADVDEADIGNVRDGQRVTFTVDAYPDEEFNGKVTQVRLNATMTSSVVTYTVIVKADNPGLKLMPGLTATISIFTKELFDVVTISEKALSFTPERNVLEQYYVQRHVKPELWRDALSIPAKKEHTQVVWVLGKDGIIRSRKIEVGASDGIRMQVTDGLRAGEKVVLELKAGSATTESATSEAGESPFMPKPPNRNKKK